MGIEGLEPSHISIFDFKSNAAADFAKSPRRREMLTLKRRTKYTKEQLEPIVSTSISIAEVLGKLGLRRAGGNFHNIQRVIEHFDISTNHMLHQAANRGKELVTFENLSTKTAIKKRLIKELGYQCQKCLNNTWLGEPIMLELEHVDGNNRNNEKSNLKLLCPNCHSQTPTWRNKKRK